jgi:dipeptidyl-peptidase 4
MKLFSTLLLFMASSLLVAANQVGLSLDSIVSGTYNPVVMPVIYPLENAATYASLDASRKKINRYDYKTGNLLETILDLDKAKGVKLKTIKGFNFNSQESKVLIWCVEKPLYRRSWVTDYYLYDIKRNLIELLSEQGNQRDAQFSPDGRSVAFVRNNNLFIKRLDYGSELTVTSDGAENAVINGATDWVYEEEFAVTRAFTWSADSKYLAYLKFNESALTDYTMTLYGRSRVDSVPAVYYPGFKTFKYPSAGGVNSTVSLYVYQLQARYTRQLTLPVSPGSYFPRIRFTAKADQLAVMSLNRAQNDFNLFLTNVKSGVSKLVYTERNETYVDPYYEAIQFTASYFTCLSERDGYRHLYVYDLNGVLKKQLTTGEWDVTNLIGVDTLNHFFYYQAAQDSPMNRSIWQVNIKGLTRKISTVEGVCTGLFNRDYSMYIQSASSLNMPPTVELFTIKGKWIRTIQSNQVLLSKLKNSLSNQKNFFKVTLKNGMALNGWMLKPVGFDSLKNYPAILLQYSGPDAQKVMNKFEIGWEYFLAEKGFVVVTVDGRGTGGRGAAFRRYLI